MRRFAFLLALALAPAPLAAHDFWLEPASYSPKPKQTIFVRAVVGSPGIPDKEIARRPNQIKQFVAVHNGSRIPVAGKSGETPAGTVTIKQEGAHVLGYESTYTYLELEAARFESYLTHEGLDQIIIQRKIRGESSSPGKESYSRSVKTLLRAGKKGNDFSTPLGLPLELVPKNDPHTAQECVQLTLLFEGKPLKSTTVRLLKTSDKTEVSRKKTDKQGNVCMSVPGPGKWLFATIHMRRASKEVRGDWMSTWSTLAFERP